MFCGAGRYASTRLRCGRTGRYNVISERIGQAILEDDGRACVQLLSKKMEEFGRRDGSWQATQWHQCELHVAPVFSRCWGPVHRRSSAVAVLGGTQSDFRGLNEERGARGTILL